MSNEIMPLEPQMDKTTETTETTKPTRKEYFSAWREKNRAKIRETWTSKNIDIECECGLTIKKYNKINHLKTQRHNLLMKEKNTF
jgi:hypothetical protein